MPTAGHVGKNTQSDEKPQSSLDSPSQINTGIHSCCRRIILFLLWVGCFTNKPIWEYRILVVPKGMREERDVSLTGRLISTVRQQYLPGHTYLLWHQYD